MNKTHAPYMKRMKANNNMNVTRVSNAHDHARKKKILKHMEHRNQWKQVSLKALEYFTENETNNSEPIIKKEQCKQHKRKLTKELGRSNRHLRG